MDFGRVKDIQGFDLSLPRDDPATAPRLARAVPHSGRPQIHVGCPVWQDDLLAKRLCPPGTPRSRRLACYARQFNALELNSTGYGMDRERLRHWTSEVTPGFKFCPKVPMDVTHSGDLDSVWELYYQHCEAAAEFGSHLGLFFLQFPDSFGPHRFPELERFLNIHAARLPLALEVRHPLWFADDGNREKLFALLEKHDITAILTDTPGRRDVLHQRLTTPAAFIRFNGHTGGPEDFRRLDDWVERVGSWLEKGLQSLYFFAHLPRMDLAADMAAYFIKNLNARSGLRVAEPRLQIEVENLSLFG